MFAFARNFSEKPKSKLISSSIASFIYSNSCIHHIGNFEYFEVFGRRREMEIVFNEDYRCRKRADVQQRNRLDAGWAVVAIVCENLEHALTHQKLNQFDFPN